MAAHKAVSQAEAKSPVETVTARARADQIAACPRRPYGHWWKPTLFLSDPQWNYLRMLLIEVDGTMVID